MNYLNYTVDDLSKIVVSSQQSNPVVHHVELESGNAGRKLIRPVLRVCDSSFEEIGFVAGSELERTPGLFESSGNLLSNFVSERSRPFWQIWPRTEMFPVEIRHATALTSDSLQMSEQKRHVRLSLTGIFYQTVVGLHDIDQSADNDVVQLQIFYLRLNPRCHLHRRLRGHEIYLSPNRSDCDCRYKQCDNDANEGLVSVEPEFSAASRAIRVDSRHHSRLPAALQQPRKNVNCASKRCRADHEMPALPVHALRMAQPISIVERSAA